MTDEQSARFQAAVDQAAASLGEHFDAVQIVDACQHQLPGGRPPGVETARPTGYHHLLRGPVGVRDHGAL